jgi:hypothetical protein
VTLEEELKALMTPVRKNTTDLEAGLQELAELSQHVQVEMAGQRETLEGLLETMQKTISIEVRRHVCMPHVSRFGKPFLILAYASCTGHTRPAGGVGAPTQ